MNMNRRTSQRDNQQFFKMVKHLNLANDLGSHDYCSNDNHINDNVYYLINNFN